MGFQTGQVIGEKERGRGRAKEEALGSRWRTSSRLRQRESDQGGLSVTCRSIHGGNRRNRGCTGCIKVAEAILPARVAKSWRLNSSCIEDGDGCFKFFTLLSVGSFLIAGQSIQSMERWEGGGQGWSFLCVSNESLSCVKSGDSLNDQVLTTVGNT